MKKIAVCFILLMLLVGNVAAETTEQDPGLLPGQRFYSLKLFVENFRIMLTINPEHKAELIRKQAELRALEIASLQTEEISAEALERVLLRQTEILERLERLVEEAKISEELSNKIMSTQAKAMTTLVNNIEKVPAKAQEALMENILRRGEKIVAYAERKSTLIRDEVEEEVAKAVMAALENLPASTEKAQQIRDDVAKKLEEHLSNSKSKGVDILRDGIGKVQERLEQFRNKNKGK